MTTLVAALDTQWRRMDGTWAVFLLILLGVALWTPADFVPVASDAGAALLKTMPIMLFAVGAIAYVKATGAENLIAKAFQGSETRMIVLAALIGGLSPFCSCEVIPFIAAMLALGTPLSAVMAFWLASPLMDPAMFIITSGGLGLDFALAKTASAVALGLIGGFGVRMLAPTGIFDNTLKPRAAPSCGCGANPFSGRPYWRFWEEANRRETFVKEGRENFLFLVKWLALAYLIEVLMIRHVPAEWIAGVLGGEGFQPILVGAFVGAPAYLNGYAAVPLLEGLLSQGMAPGAAMSFAIAGGVSSIPAAIAVWALVKPRVFAAYLGFALIGALAAGLTWSFIA